MNYPEKYRKKAIEYRKEIHNVFKVAISTVREWERQYREEGNLKQKKTYLRKIQSMLMKWEQIHIFTENMDMPPKGECILGFISGRKEKGEGIVAAKLGKIIIKPLEYSGIMGSEQFELWFEKKTFAVTA